MLHLDVTSVSRTLREWSWRMTIYYVSFMSRTTSRMEHLACGCNKLTSVRKLISAGASDTVTDGWGNTPLHQAAVYASGDVVREILAAGQTSLLRVHSI